MANGRNPGRRKVDTGRDPGGFMAIPWSVLDSAAYMGLSDSAKALLVEVARQYHKDDNGRMLLPRVYLARRCWFSAGAIQQAKAELIAAGLIFETVKGARPNRASWYAVTWRMLDKIPGYDVGAEKAFERGAYRKTLPKEKRPPPSAPANAKKKRNAVLIPVAGTGNASIVPAPGTESTATVPAPGAIRAVFDPLSVPAPGHPLDVAISGVRSEGSPVEVGPASKGEKAPARQAAARTATPTTCQHPGCQTLTLRRAFCGKHQPVASTRTQRLVALPNGSSGTAAVL